MKFTANETGGNFSETAYGSASLTTSSASLTTSSASLTTCSAFFAQYEFNLFYLQRGNKHYELTNHLGNVLTVITDKRLLSCMGDTFQSSFANIVSATDYSPFGAPLAGRVFSANEYRFGFGGQEKDDEVSGTNNSYSAEHWQYDPRIGRRFNIDPESYKLSAWSAYSTFYNNPNYYTDVDGNIPFPVAMKYVKAGLFDWGKQAGFHNNDQEYGKRSTGKTHYGIDFNVRSNLEKGMAILNLADGIVIDAGYMKGRGNFIVIRHGNGYITSFFHMDDKPTLKVGDNISESQKIGEIGKTGGKYPVHGHLEITLLPDPTVSNKKALAIYDAHKNTINPRDIIDSKEGDLQIIANAGQKIKPNTWSIQNPNGRLLGWLNYIGSPLGAHSDTSNSSENSKAKESGGSERVKETVILIEPRKLEKIQ